MLVSLKTINIWQSYAAKEMRMPIHGFAFFFVVEMFCGNSGDFHLSIGHKDLNHLTFFDNYLGYSWRKMGR